MWSGVLATSAAGVLMATGATLLYGTSPAGTPQPKPIVDTPAPNTPDQAAITRIADQLGTWSRELDSLKSALQADQQQWRTQQEHWQREWQRKEAEWADHAGQLQRALDRLTTQQARLDAEQRTLATELRVALARAEQSPTPAPESPGHAPQQPRPAQSPQPTQPAEIHPPAQTPPITPVPTDPRPAVPRAGSPDRGGDATHAAPVRLWTDSTGAYRVQAALVDVDERTVRLRTPDGKIISVALERLSRGDQDFALGLAPGPRPTHP
jgi:hypothetical protein